MARANLLSLSKRSNFKHRCLYKGCGVSVRGSQLTFHK